MFNVTQTTIYTKLLDGVDVGLPKWHICGRGLNRSVHEGMNNISNIKVHLLKIHRGNVNIKEINLIFGMFMES